MAEGDELVSNLTATNNQNVDIKILNIDEKIKVLSKKANDIQMEQKSRIEQQDIKLSSLAIHLETIEKRQEETLKLLTGLRSELAGISSGMARRDSLILGSGVVSGFTSVRRDSLVLDSYSGGAGGSIPVLEVEPWDPSPEIQEVIDSLLERQFILSPWVRGKRLRNQLRLVLKDALEAGPKRRSTITKIVYDAHQLYPVWRNRTRETMFENWERVQAMKPSDAATVIFTQFKRQRFPDEVESMILYAEHMVEVGQYLKRKASERAERAGKTLYTPIAVTNSKFWYEVRKKIADVLDMKKGNLERRRSSNSPLDDEDSDDETEAKIRLIKRVDHIQAEDDTKNGMQIQTRSSESMSDFDEKL